MYGEHRKDAFHAGEGRDKGIHTAPYLKLKHNEKYRQDTRQVTTSPKQKVTIEKDYSMGHKKYIIALWNQWMKFQI